MSFVEIGDDGSGTILDSIYYSENNFKLVPWEGYDSVLASYEEQEFWID